MDQQDFAIETLTTDKVATPPAKSYFEIPKPAADKDLLHDSEERFRQLAESINEVFWICSSRTQQFLYISPAYEKIWGRSCQSLYDDPHTLLESLMPEDRSRLAAMFSLAPGNPQTEIEYRILRPDNSLRWIRTRTFPAQNRGLEVERIVGVSQDVTDRKAAEKAILEIGTRERRRIGHELHDGLLQRLTGISYLNKVLQQRLARSASKEAAEAASIGEMLLEAIRETRALARGLNPVQLDALGLMSALAELARSTEKVYKVPCVFECEAGIQIHDNDAATHLYRIAQESVTNAIKHAEAARITLSLKEAQGFLTLRIDDDGRGVPEKISNDVGMGLHIMHHRARMIGAFLSVRGNDGGGTSVVCSYPSQPRR